MPYGAYTRKQRRLAAVAAPRKKITSDADGVAAGEARLVLGCDIVVAAGREALGKMREGHTRSIVNLQETPTAGFALDPDLRFPSQELRTLLEQATGQGGTDFVDGTKLATGLLGDAIASNLFMLGYAYQRGTVPVSAEVIMQAIEFNGVAVAMNQRAFLWGRQAAHDLASGVPAAKKKAKRR